MSAHQTSTVIISSFSIVWQLWHLQLALELDMLGSLKEMDDVYELEVAEVKVRADGELHINGRLVHAHRQARMHTRLQLALHLSLALHICCFA